MPHVKIATAITLKLKVYIVNQ